MNAYKLVWYASCREIGQLKAELQKASLESISERCSRTQVQCCHVCDRMGCNDNMSEAKNTILQLNASLAGARDRCKDLEDRNGKLASRLGGLTLQVLEREKEIKVLALQVATQESLIETLVNNDQFMPAVRELLRVCVDAHRMFNEIISANGPYPYLNMTSVVPVSYTHLTLPTNREV